MTVIYKPQFKYISHTPYRQSGAVLIVSLIMLALITMITLSSVKSTAMEERMAGNLRDHNLAFQAAEAALREAEAFLDANNLPVFDNTVAGFKTNAGTFENRSGFLEYWQEDHDWANDSVEYANTIPLTNAKPRYVIEELEPIPLAGGSKKFGPLDGNMVYRVTALGYGGNNQTQVVLQSTFRR